MNTKDFGVMLGGVAAVAGLAYARSKMSGSLSESDTHERWQPPDTTTYQETVWDLDPRFWFQKHASALISDLNGINPSNRAEEVASIASKYRSIADREYAEGTQKLESIHSDVMKAVAKGKRLVNLGLDDVKRNHER